MLGRRRIYDRLVDAGLAYVCAACSSETSAVVFHSAEGVSSTQVEGWFSRWRQPPNTQHAAEGGRR